MKFISQGVTFFSVAYGTRSSLKQLRVLTEVEQEGSNRSIKKEREVVLLDARDTLMFWALFGLSQVFSAYFEVLVNWLPGYYYVKSLALLLVTFPKLRFTHAVFEKGVVPLLDVCHAEIERRGGLVPLAVVCAYEAPFLAADFLFPFSRERPFHEPEHLSNADPDHEPQVLAEAMFPPLPPTPPQLRTRLARTPGQSASRVESLRKAVGESARRLSSLAQLPTPRGLERWAAWEEDEEEPSSSDEERAFDLMPNFAESSDPDMPPSPPLMPSHLRSPEAGDENALPTTSRGPGARAVVKSLAALFSLDAHSPPAGSSLRRRTLQPTLQPRPRGGETAEDVYFRHMGSRPNRQSAGAAMSRPAPMPLPAWPGPLPALRPSDRSGSARQPVEKALDSSFDVALSTGRISMRRGGGKQR